MEKGHRKKARAVALSVCSLISAAAITFGGCVVSLTCISHIDRDGNGKCDNCGTKMTVVISNVEKLEIATTPKKLYYAFNEQLAYSDGVLAVTYKDGTKETVPFTDERVTVTAPGMGSAGHKFVMVAFEGATVRYQIEVGVAKYSVKFDLGYEAENTVPDQFVASASNAVQPESPVREGYDFGGWYKDGKFTAVFNFEMEPIMGETTVYAKWIEKIAIVYDENYTGGRKIDGFTLNGKLDPAVTPSEREGYTFDGWYTDANCTVRVDYNAEIKEKTTVYASWISDTATTYTVTFNMNYGAEPQTTTQLVAEGKTVNAPANPKRADVSTKGHQSQNFTFGGWYTDAACTAKYDFSKPVNGDTELFAKWTGTYIFEAEHVVLDGKQGMGASGGAQGPDMVDGVPPASLGMNASNGYYLTYLFVYGLNIDFVIQSDRDVTDAKLTFRITADDGQGKFALAPISYTESTTANGTDISTYDISINGKPIDYDVIEITDVGGDLFPDTAGRRPFTDHVITLNLNLKKGTNTLSFTALNNVPAGGTRTTTAPVIDCIKITTSANLNWDPKTANEFGQ